ncbi:hypothetical protein GH714_026977 [Hevea brasiliensis]|uniref:Bet v I/Major latex protein domain-containing protein n=1 Tax=Hevea brasiliensis TaxID=3981 RepID=A0A6A6NJA4_HEVBR|nr:hypothetical protein GH714_026977 [Hevea brasiliensis]
MASSGKLDVEVHIKSSPDKFWNSIRNSTTLFPKVFPDQYKNIQVLEAMERLLVLFASSLMLKVLRLLRYRKRGSMLLTKQLSTSLTV